MTDDPIKSKWVIENESIISFQLDKHNKLYIERIGDGFTLKVFDSRGHDHKPDKQILLYANRLMDSQLGHLEVK